jgi:hypothetical protein
MKISHIKRTAQTKGQKTRDKKEKEKDRTMRDHYKMLREEM